MLAFGPEILSSIPEIGSPFPMGKAAKNEGSFGKVNVDDGGGSEESNGRRGGGE